MQVALKLLSNFDSLDLKALGNETTRLVTAGIESFMLKKETKCRSIIEPYYDKLIDIFADKGVKNLQDLSLCQSAELVSPSDINYVSNCKRRNHRKPINKQEAKLYWSSHGL